MQKNYPARAKGLLWGLFSATATYSAFILPAFIFSTLKTQSNYTAPIWFLKVYVGVTLFCALYHSLYRVKTITFDLGFNANAIKTIAIATNTLVIAGTCAIIAAMLFS